MESFSDMLLQIAEPGMSEAPHSVHCAVGIDLGTTNSLVATVRDGRAEVICDAAGEALDKAGRTMKLAYPGGVSIDRISPEGDENAFEFPHPKFADSIYDYSFSGLKTKVINYVHNAEQKGESVNVPDLAASFQKAVVDILLSHFEAAAESLGYTKLVIAGGVSANSKLRAEAEKMCKKHSWSLTIPELKYCGDNAAMIASQGYFEYLAGVSADEGLNAFATMPIDNPTF